MFCAVSAKSPHQLRLTLCNPMDYIQPARLLCPWDFPSKSIGVGCHFLLQEIFPTQRSNPHLLSLLHWHWQAGSFTTSATWEAQKWSRLEENISQFAKTVCSHSSAFGGIFGTDLLYIFLTPLLQKCPCNCTMTEEDRTFFYLGFGLVLWAASFH